MRFLYLLFGNDRALLLDTGATADPERFPLRHTIDRLVAIWLAKTVADRRGVHRRDDFIIYNEVGPGDQLRTMSRGLAHRLWRRS